MPLGPVGWLVETIEEVECPVCSAETVALTPPDAVPIDTVREHDPPLPPEADTAVRTTGPNDHEFVVYLAE